MAKSVMYANMPTATYTHRIEESNTPVECNLPVHTLGSDQFPLNNSVKEIGTQDEYV